MRNCEYKTWLSLTCAEVPSNTIVTTLLALHTFWHVRNKGGLLPTLAGQSTWAKSISLNGHVPICLCYDLYLHSDSPPINFEFILKWIQVDSLEYRWKHAQDALRTHLRSCGVGPTRIWTHSFSSVDSGLSWDTPRQRQLNFFSTSLV